MTTMPFIYKYKPMLFKDFEIEKDIITIFNTFISMDNLNILIIGNSGSGKTTIINALIKEYYNNTVYDNNNILIINSLKDQGIQYYRNEVKTFCQTRSSVNNKKKIVVLDDIDNINEQSQQVFRNYIDKYSNNVHFISSCSNIQKVIDSVQSRQIIIKLKSLNNNNMRNILYKIKTNENIIINKDAEDFILSISNGSIRILLNYLEKFKLLNKDIITFELVENICTNISFTIFNKYTQLIIHNNMKEAIDIFYELYDKGYSVMDIYDNYFIFIKITDILSETQKYEIIKLLCKYISIFHNIHEDEIELALFTNNLSKLISI